MPMGRVNRSSRQGFQTLRTGQDFETFRLKFIKYLLQKNLMTLGLYKETYSTYYTYSLNIQNFMHYFIVSISYFVVTL